MDRRKDILLPFLAQGVTQVAWVVEDLERAVEMHHRLFGIGPWHFYLYDRELLSMMRIHGKDTEYAMDTAVANAGPTRLEIVQPVSGDTIYREFARKNGYGKVHHFGLAVDNMQESLEIARRAGFTVTMEGSGYGLDGDGHFAYLDTEEAFGITLELMERPRRRREPRKIFPAPRPERALRVCRRWSLFRDTPTKDTASSRNTGAPLLPAATAHRRRKQVMKRFVVSILALVAVLSIVHAQTPAAKAERYWSRTTPAHGNTREIAHQIRSLVGGDVFEIQTLVPYPADYEAIKQKAMEEAGSSADKPALKSKVKNFRSYDIVFVGSPVWWATLPPPVSSFLSEYDFKGKTIVPFCTHLGSGQGRTISAITALCPDSTILTGIAIRGDAVKGAKRDVSEWLRQNRLLE